jgi:hypothetical protein
LEISCLPLSASIEKHSPVWRVKGTAPDSFVTS